MSFNWEEATRTILARWGEVETALSSQSSHPFHKEFTASSPEHIISSVRMLLGERSRHTKTELTPKEFLDIFSTAVAEYCDAKKGEALAEGRMTEAGLILGKKMRLFAALSEWADQHTREIREPNREPDEDDGDEPTLVPREGRRRF